jgi:hypothetical protein
MSRKILSDPLFGRENYYLMSPAIVLQEGNEEERGGRELTFLSYQGEKWLLVWLCVF